MAMTRRQALLLYVVGERMSTKALKKWHWREWLTAAKAGPPRRRKLSRGERRWKPARRGGDDRRSAVIARYGMGSIASNKHLGWNRSHSRGNTVTRHFRQSLRGKQHLDAIDFVARV
jgi:hypothetical protein